MNNKELLESQERWTLGFCNENGVAVPAKPKTFVMRREVSPLYSIGSDVPIMWETRPIDFANQYEQKPCGEIRNPELESPGVEFQSYGGIVDIKTNAITEKDFQWPVILSAFGPSMDEIVLSQPFLSLFPAGKVKWIAEPRETNLIDYRSEYQQTPPTSIVDIKTKSITIDDLYGMYDKLATNTGTQDTLLVHPETWKILSSCYTDHQEFLSMWEAYKDAALGADFDRDALDVVLEDLYPKKEVWFITPHDLRSSRDDKPVGYQLERSGWSDYEDD